MLPRAGMVTYAVGYLLGVLYVQQLSDLPDQWLIAGVLLCLFVILVTLRRFFSLDRQYSNAAAISSCCHDSTVLYPASRSSLVVPDGYTPWPHITLIILHIILINIGILHSSLFAEDAIKYQLADELAAKDIIVTGKVASVPVLSKSAFGGSAGKHVQRFVFDIASMEWPESAALKAQPKIETFPKRIRLSWHDGYVRAGEYWRIKVRLKPPHGFMNPGGFDYEAWLFQQGIHATGYVRQTGENRMLYEKDSAISMPALFRDISVNRFREKVAERIDSLTPSDGHDGESLSSFALIKALAIGDKSSISSSQWQTLSNTGTSHLMAISGLHISLASLFAYLLLRYSLPVWLMRRIPSQHIALMGGLLVAFIYASVAGFAVATQRAFIMLCVLVIMTLLRRNTRPVDTLGMAAFVVLLIDPLAVLSAGFWFSFSAVAVIFISLTDTGATTTDTSAQDDSLLKDEASSSSYQRFKSIIVSICWKWTSLQLMISVMLLPLSLYMFQQGSLVSPLANLLLIPYVSFLVVPVVLLALIAVAAGSLLSSFWLSDTLFLLAAYLLDFIWPYLRNLSDMPYAVWVNGSLGSGSVLMATMAMLAIYYSKRIAAGLSQRFSADSNLFRIAIVFLFTPVILMLLDPETRLSSHSDKLVPGDYRIIMLDVGQGSAAVIETKNHVVIFDTGARFSDRLDAGKSVVIPYLRAQAIDKIDRLIISHGDADHIGGAKAILNDYPQTELFGQDIAQLVAGHSLHEAMMDNEKICTAGQRWVWDGVVFQILSPDLAGEDGAKASASKPASIKRNNRSCVLRVSSPAGSVLFTGDIEKRVERRLVEKYVSPSASLLASDILMVPHHGSNTSSSRSFIEAVDPKIALISVGYKNRYRLPSEKVTARYQRYGIELYDTAASGAVSITLREGGIMDILRYRQQARRYWHHVVPI